MAKHSRFVSYLDHQELPLAVRVIAPQVKEYRIQPVYVLCGVALVEFLDLYLQY